jgi:predicted nucleic-acid-binding Zn-ribbon protein
MSKEVTLKKRCSKCNVGEMFIQHDMAVFASMPQRYFHKCTWCGDSELYDKIYPSTIIEHDIKEERWE